MRGDRKHHRCVLFDWGDTLMRDFPEFSGPMATWPRVESLPYAREALDNAAFPRVARRRSDQLR